MSKNLTVVKNDIEIITVIVPAGLSGVTTFQLSSKEFESSIIFSITGITSFGQTKIFTISANQNNIDERVYFYQVLNENTQIESGSYNIVSAANYNGSTTISGTSGQVINFYNKPEINLYSASTLNNVNSRLLITNFNSFSGNNLTNLSGKLNVTTFSSFSGNNLTNLSGKLNVSSFGVYSGITNTNINSRLLSSDVSSWAKASVKPTYNYSEVGGLASGGTAINSLKLGNILPAGYLASGATAINSNKLNNKLPAYYLNTGSTIAYATAAGSAPASDVSSWAKAGTKPTYSASETGSVSTTNFNSFSGSTASAIALKAPIANPTFTGVLTTPILKLTATAAKTSETTVAFIKSDGTILSGVTSAGVTVHSALTNLNYASAGHIGFQAALSGGTGFVKSAAGAITYDNSTYITGTPWTVLGYITSSALTPYALQSSITTITGTTLNNYYTKTQIISYSASTSTLIGTKLNSSGTAADSSKLGGILPAGYLLSGGTAKNSLCLGGALANTYAPLASPTFTGTVAGISAAMVGALASTGCATDSAKLNNVLPAGYLLSGSTAKNSTCLNGQLSNYYLASTACAADSAKLNNVAASGYLTTSACAADSAKFNNVLPAGYLLSGSTAKNSTCLNGQLASYYLASTGTSVNSSCLNGHTEAALSVANSACLGGALANTYAPLASPVFTTCVTLPTPFKIGTISVIATGTVINYLTGATSNIQTQITTKAPIASPTFTTIATAPIVCATTCFAGAGTGLSGTAASLTANNASCLGGALASTFAPKASPTLTGTVVLPTPFTIGAVSMTATGTEMNYLVGVTSLIQTQLNAKAPISLTVNAQTASYTLVLADAYKIVTMSNASANNLTVPLNSSVAYSVGTQITIIAIGAGQTTIVATGGVTVSSAGGALKLRVQYSSATLLKVGTDLWYLVGDITT